MKKIYLHLVALLVVTLLLNACKKGTNPTVTPPPVVVDPNAAIYPKKEMRAVWIASVFGLDWPQSVYNVTAQKKQYTDYLDKFKAMNINAIY